MAEDDCKVLMNLSLNEFEIDIKIIESIKQDEVIYNHFQQLLDLYLRIKIDNIQIYKRIN